MKGIAFFILAAAYSVCIDSVADDSIPSQHTILCDTINLSNSRETQPIDSCSALKATRDRLIAVKTNIVPWGFGVANLGIEIEISKSFSISLPVWWSPYFISKKYALRTLLLQPECRYWLKDTGTSHFFGIHAGAVWYNIRFKDIRYQDVTFPLLNGGITYGYALRLNKHFYAEFSIGVGYVFTKYDRFYNIDNGAKIDTRQTSYVGIDQLGISLVYHLDL